MAQFEALYGRRCRSPIGWFDAFEVRPWGTDLLRESLDKFKLIQDRLLMAQSRQKSYADRKIRDLEFMVGERVLLKFSPMKGVMRFGKKGKLSPRLVLSRLWSVLVRWHISWLCHLGCQVFILYFIFPCLRSIIRVVIM